MPTTRQRVDRLDVLKLFGDINGDGRWCMSSTPATRLRAFCTETRWRSNAAPNRRSRSHILLNNMQPNPGGTDCFTYQEKTVNGATFVVDVAITLTVRTQHQDPVTGAYQNETKALLNVAPRNVFNAWELASHRQQSRAAHAGQRSTLLRIRCSPNPGTRVQDTLNERGIAMVMALFMVLPPGRGLVLDVRLPDRDVREHQLPARPSRATERNPASIRRPTICFTPTPRPGRRPIRCQL